MRIAALLMCLALQACAIDGSCVWGGGTQAEADKCAEKNFGRAGAAYLREQAQRCPSCGTRQAALAGAYTQYCVLNCMYFSPRAPT